MNERFLSHAKIMERSRKPHVMVVEDEGDPICWWCGKGQGDDIHLSVQAADLLGFPYDWPPSKKTAR